MDEEADAQQERGHRHGPRRERRDGLRLDGAGQSKGFYKGNGQAILWALNAKSGAVKWKWEEVPKDLWSDKLTNINSGGGQWDPPSFDANGDLYVGVSNPAPFPGAKAARTARGRPGPNLYTDSIVKLNKDTGKLEWHYQLTPHDINDWDLQNSPILTKANGKDVVIAAGKAGIVVAVDQATGKMLWKTPVGMHNGHDNDGLLTLAQAKAKLKSPLQVFPGILGGVESQIASDGTNVYAAVNNLASTYPTSNKGIKLGDFTKGHRRHRRAQPGDRQDRLGPQAHQSPYGAASLTNDVALHDDVRRQGLGAQHQDRQGALEREAPGGHQHAGRDRRATRSSPPAPSRRARPRRPRSLPIGCRA